MIDLTKVGSNGLPRSITVNGKPYFIQTDFQFYILFSRMITEQHTLEDYDIFYIGSVPAFKQEGLNELSKFAFPVNELPRNPEPSEAIILDYEKDADMIFSAFWHYYNIDLCDPQLHLHWYKFLALLNSIKDTKLNDIMNFRSYEPSANDPKEYKKTMLKMKEQWKIDKVLPDSILEEVEEWERKNHIK